MRPTASENAVLARLQAGELSIGPMLLSPDPHVTGIAAEAGFDFVMPDLEHTAVALHELEAVVHAAHRAGIGAMVRVPGCEKRDILPSLETGVDGIMVPTVETADEARSVVRAARYGPEGARGAYYLGYVSRYGAVPQAEHFARANRELLIILQIETKRGAENVAEIAAVEGVDCLLVGPGDLSQSLGVPWQFDHPSVRTAVRAVFTAAREAGRIPGIMPANLAHAAECVEAGARLLLWGPDLALMRRAFHEDVAALRGTLAWRPARD